MGNKATKEQIKKWLDRAVGEAQKRDPISVKRKELKEKRIKRKEAIARKYGF